MNEKQMENLLKLNFDIIFMDSKYLRVDFNYLWKFAYKKGLKVKNRVGLKYMNYFLFR